MHARESATSRLASFGVEIHLSSVAASKADKLGAKRIDSCRQVLHAAQFAPIRALAAGVLGNLLITA